MSLFCSIDKSNSGSFVYKLANRALPFLIGEGAAKNSSRSRPAAQRRSINQLVPRHTDTDLNTWFVGALVAAGRCHGPQQRGIGRLSSKPLRRLCHTKNTNGSQHSFGSRQQMHTKTAHSACPNENNTSDLEHERDSKKDLLALVDQYTGESTTDQVPPLRLPSQERGVLSPQFLAPSNPNDADWPPRSYTWPAHGEDRETIEELEHLLEDTCSDPGEIYKLYRAIPAPRIPYLHADIRHKLLHSLAILERKDEYSMLRYLSIVDDMKACSIPLRTDEWNNVISFTGRYVVRTTDVEVESVLRVWRDMERVAGVRSNSATFNILFDVATKAGKFALAEKIYEEMQTRGLPYNRYHHVSLIHHYGLQGDADGVRSAYRDLVNSGEIVDTVVLNSLLSSLLLVGEPQAAEQVYNKMKALHAERPGSLVDAKKPKPPRDYRMAREVTATLRHMAKLAQAHPSRLPKFQKAAQVAPDIQTYKCLVKYFAIKAGDLEKIALFLDEMRWYKTPLDGSLFLYLFTGFAMHGGIRYSSWTGARLESVWEAYMAAVNTSGGASDGLYLGKHVIIWVLKAFRQCMGTDQMISVWIQMKEQWRLTEEETDQVTHVLRSLTEDS